MRRRALLGMATTSVVCGLACAACLDFDSLGRQGPDAGCTNLVADPSFERYAWTGSSKTTVDRVLQPHTGTYAVQVCVADPAAPYWVYISPPLGVAEAGVRYLARSWVKVAPGLRLRMYFREYPGGGLPPVSNDTSSVATTDDWQELDVPTYTAVGPALDGGAGARFEVYYDVVSRAGTTQTGDCFLVDDVYAGRESCP